MTRSYKALHARITKRADKVEWNDAAHLCCDLEGLDDPEGRRQVEVLFDKVLFWTDRACCIRITDHEFVLWARKVVANQDGCITPKEAFLTGLLTAAMMTTKFPSV